MYDPDLLMYRLICVMQFVTYSNQPAEDIGPNSRTENSAIQPPHPPEKFYATRSWKKTLFRRSRAFVHISFSERNLRFHIFRSIKCTRIPQHTFTVKLFPDKFACKKKVQGELKVDKVKQQIVCR